MIFSLELGLIHVILLQMQECLCVLVCDDSEEVSAAAQSFLEYLFSSSDKHHIERDFAEIFSRFVLLLHEIGVLGLKTDNLF